MTAEPGAIRVTVRLYSVLRHRDGRIVDRLALELPPGSRVGDVVRLLAVDPRLEPLLTVNDEPATAATPLADGDRLAIIPSVAGG
jgi:molybdopterin converting factor small subunit